MQGRSRLDRDLWDAGEVTGHLVPPGSVFAFLAGHRRELFPDSFTADLFPSVTGRPSLPADLVGAVLVLKELYDLSDAQTADALKFDIRWKVACGRSLMQMSFDPSTLVYWRKRIAASERPDRGFDQIPYQCARSSAAACDRSHIHALTSFGKSTCRQSAPRKPAPIQRRDLVTDRSCDGCVTSPPHRRPRLPYPPLATATRRGRSSWSGFSVGNRDCVLSHGPH